MAPRGSRHPCVPHPPCAAHLLWLHVDASDALRGQRERGRVVPGNSFHRHAGRAEATTRALGAGVPEGWDEVRVLDRATTSGGLRLAHGERAVVDAGAPWTRSRPQPPAGHAAPRARALRDRTPPK